MSEINTLEWVFCVGRVQQEREIDQYSESDQGETKEVSGKSLFSKHSICFIVEIALLLVLYELQLISLRNLEVYFMNRKVKHSLVFTVKHRKAKHRKAKQS